MSDGQGSQGAQLVDVNGGSGWWQVSRHHGGGGTHRDWSYSQGARGEAATDGGGGIWSGGPGR